MLKLPTLSLPSLLSNIIRFTHNLLGLPTEKSENVRSDSVPLREYQSLTLHHVAANVAEDKEFDDSFASSLGTSLAAGYMPALSEVDEGGLQFAGLGSTLEFSTSVSNSDFQLEDAVTSLLCAWGLVFTCDIAMPGDGISKVIDSNHSSSQSNQAEMSNTTLLLTRSTFDLFKILQDKKDVASEIANANVFVGIIFSLLPLNSIAQSHLCTAAALANGILVIKLTKLLQSFLPPVHVQRMEMRPFIDYVNSMSTGMSEISDLLDSMTAIIEHTYGMGPVSNKSNCFYVPFSLKNRVENQLTSTTSALVPASSLLLQLSQRFHQDVNAREQIVKRQIASTIADSNLQNREMSLLYNELSECLNNALVTIQYANTQIRWISNQDKTCNSITSNLPNQRKVNKFVSMLEQYDLVGIFEYVHSLINYKQVVTSHFIPSKLPKRVKSVFILLCQIMTWYFCNETPSITLSSHMPEEVTIFRKKISEVAQNKCLSQFWTVDHTLELLVASQNWLKACSFLQKIGDWKKMFLLATVVVHHSRSMRLRTAEYIELKNLSYHLAIEKVLYGIGLKMSLVAKGDGSEVPRISCISSLSDSQDSHLQRQDVIKFVSDFLTVCAHAKLDSVLLTCVCSVVAELTLCCQKFPLEVPSAIYLPSPPLFCPQPAVAKEVSYF